MVISTRDFPISSILKNICSTIRIRRLIASYQLQACLINSDFAGSMQTEMHMCIPGIGGVKISCDGDHDHDRCWRVLFRRMALRYVPCFQLRATASVSGAAHVLDEQDMGVEVKFAGTTCWSVDLQFHLSRHLCFHCYLHFSVTCKQRFVHILAFCRSPFPTAFIFPAT